jgi:DNA-binding NarL/FixJ family response regulator
MRHALIAGVHESWISWMFQRPVKQESAVNKPIFRIGCLFGARKDSTITIANVSIQVTGSAENRDCSDKDAAVQDIIRLLLVDDHVLVREGIARLLSSQPDLKVVGEADTIEDGIRIIQKTPVDLVLLDVHLGKQPPRSFVELARAAGFTGKVLVVTAGVSKSEAESLLREGCSGIFLKHEPPSRLIERIRVVSKETRAPGVMPDEAALEEFAGNHVQYPPLTVREIDVLRRVVAGRTNKEIAYQLGVSEPLIKMVVHQLFDKAGVRSRSQLVRSALERYWRELEEDSEGSSA